jgi:hypothetical protein
VVVEGAISHELKDKEELDIVRLVRPPILQIAYAAAPAFELHYVLVSCLADCGPLGEEILKFSI